MAAFETGPRDKDILLVLSAVITPTGDPFTLMIVFLPLYLLYELSIKIVRA